MRKIIIGVMGPGAKATEQNIKDAFEVGALIAKNNWVLLSGGRNSGVMDAVNQGARSLGGLTVGVLPTKHLELISDAVDIPIITDMGSARNNINVISSNVVIACGMESGTASEVSLAIKSEKKVILLNCGCEAEAFFKKIGGDLIFVASNPEEVIKLVKENLS